MKNFFKLFQKKNEVFAIKYTSEEQKNYFKFVKSQIEKKMKQVIVTSEIMLKIIEKYIREKDAKINLIKFAEEDLELEKEIKFYIIEIQNKKMEYLDKLMSKLECISNSSSIDIEEIEIIVKDNENNRFIRIKIWVNGIIEIESKVNKENELDDILRIIKLQLEWKA